MQRIAPPRFGVWLLLTVAGCAAAAPHRHTVIESGQWLGSASLPTGWSKDGSNGLVGRPQATPLRTGWQLSSSPARIQLRLQLAAADTTAASMMIGASHIGFCGRDGRPFVEGKIFGRGTQSFEEIEIPRAEPFDVVVERARGQLLITLDDQPLPSFPDPGGDLGEVSLRPLRDTMRVERLCLEGLEPVPPVIGTGRIVWAAGDGGVSIYRIPASCVAQNGDILAFAEARHDGGSDSGDIDLVMKRSTDGGRTWSAAQTVWDDGGNTCGNPCPVVVRATGEVLLFATHNLGEDHESEIIRGTARGTRTVHVLRSRDHGHTWTAARDITAETKRADWTWYATGPGAAIQLEHGPFSERIVVPCDHIEAETKDYYSHVFYSDDGGKTFVLGGSSPNDGVNECEVVELPEGHLLLNMRNYDRSQPTRQQCQSQDGGQTWHAQQHVPDLVEPICQASIRRYRWADERGPAVLLFSNPASRFGRYSLSLKASIDHGATWPWTARIDSGPSAYSCLSVLPDGAVLCLYESGPYRSIRAHRISATELRRVLARAPIGLQLPASR